MDTCRRLGAKLRSIDFQVGLAFWVFGTCNNFAYVIMLSAANDILSSESNTTQPTPAPPDNMTLTGVTNRRDLDCNLVGTGAILLADVLPALIVKIVAPVFIQKIAFSIKIIFIGVMAMVSFVIVAFSKAIWVSLLGVIFASLSSGVGEITFLALTASYEKSSLQGWSSGTGAAGLLGSLVYLGLTMAVSPRVALLIILLVPLLLVIWYFALLPARKQERLADPNSPERPLAWTEVPQDEVSASEDDDERHAASDTATTAQVEPTCQEKVRLIAPMLHLMIPLGFVYFFEYLINQAFMELLYFPKAFVVHKEQYRWYQSIYQLGVFISRSSLFLFTFRYIWVLSILQGLNVVLLLTQIMYFFIPSIWIVFVIILYEGFLGGLAYVNTFFFILQLPMPQFAEYRMGVASVSDGVGITLAGALAVPLHNILCSSF